jgi:hypothetical protein
MLYICLANYVIQVHFDGLLTSELCFIVLSLDSLGGVDDDSVQSSVHNRLSLILFLLTECFIIKQIVGYDNNTVTLRKVE